MRAELDAVTTGFGKLPVLAASALKLVRVNAGATALESTNLIDGITIGSVTPAPGTFTTLASTGLATLASATITGALVANGNVTLGDALADTITIGGGSSKNATGNWVFAAPSSGATLAVSSIAASTTAVLQGAGATTGGQYAQFLNSGNSLNVGVESSVGGQLLTGSTANAGVVSTNSAVPLQFGAGNRLAVTIVSAGNVTIAAPSSGDTLAIANVGGGRAYYAFGALSGGVVQTKNENTSNTASSDSRHIMTVGGTSAGDPYWVAEIPAGTSWAFGADNSDSDKFKISASTALGTSDTISILPAGNVTIAAPTAGVGLTVNGTAATGRNGVQLSGTTTGFHYLGFDNTSGNALIGIDNSAGAGLMTGTDAYSLVLGTTNARSVWIGTNNTARVQIGSTGNVTLAAPTAGVGFTQTGFAGSDTAIFNGGTSGSFRVTDRGLPYGTSIHNNAGAVTGATNQYITSGTYTPTLFSDNNIASSGANIAQWMRVGNVVTVAGRVTIDPTSASVSTALGISLPIASAFPGGTATHIGGTAVRGTTSVVMLAAYVVADETNSRATLTYLNDADVSNQAWYFTFTYLVL